MQPRSTRRTLGTLVALVLGGLAVVPSAEAATVAVERGPPAEKGVGSEQLTYRAAAGENNAVTITIAGEAEGVVQLTVVDTGAPLAPGAGCSGGGAVGAPVSCPIHRSNPEPHGVYSPNDPFKGTYWQSRSRPSSARGRTPSTPPRSPSRPVPMRAMGTSGSR